MIEKLAIATYFLFAFQLFSCLVTPESCLDLYGSGFHIFSIIGQLLQFLPTDFNYNSGFQVEAGVPYFWRGRIPLGADLIF